MSPRRRAPDSAAKPAAPKIRVLFVCMGNICRSPTAEGVFRKLVEAEGLSAAIAIDSAGTHDYHIGEASDPRTVAAAAARGIDLSRRRGRQVSAADFDRFDYVLAMDGDNLRHLAALAGKAGAGKLGLFLDFAPELGVREVPDPYFGGADGFARVLDLVEAGARGLLGELRKRHLS